MVLIQKIGICKRYAGIRVKAAIFVIGYDFVKIIFGLF